MCGIPLSDSGGGPPADPFLDEPCDVLDQAEHPLEVLIGRGEGRLELEHVATDPAELAEQAAPGGELPGVRADRRGRLLGAAVQHVVDADEKPGTADVT